MSLESFILICIAVYVIGKIFSDSNDKKIDSNNEKVDSNSKKFEYREIRDYQIPIKKNLQSHSLTFPKSNKYQNRKSEVEIGLEYEMYVGHLYEARGFSVIYNGILQGMNDRGIDLICTRGKLVHLVQCKRWSNNHHDTIGEHLIRKLVNSTKNFPVKPGSIMTPVFYSTVPFEENAKILAEALGVFCRGNRKHEWALRDWLKKSGWTVESFKQNLEVKA